MKNHVGAVDKHLHKRHFIMHALATFHLLELVEFRHAREAILLIKT